MAIDECGTEVMVGSDYMSEAGAYADMNELKNNYPEYRRFWVEKFNNWLNDDYLDDFGNDLKEYY
jgi:hypothetical protein